MSALTSVSSLAVDAFFRSAANGPVPVHKEAVTQWVTKPLHSWRHTATGRQARLAGAAQEHTLSEYKKTKLVLSFPFLALVECGQNYTALGLQLKLVCIID